MSTWELMQQKMQLQMQKHHADQQMMIMHSMHMQGQFCPCEDNKLRHVLLVRNESDSLSNT